MRDHKWIQGTDAVVLEHLEEELRRLQSADSSLEALGCSDSEEVRKAFLAITKIYHPNRFARRPGTIRTLANEVFLRLKQAYDKAKGEAASQTLQQTRVKIANEKQERADRRRVSSASKTPMDTAERRQQKGRRREQVRNRLATNSSTTQRTAQVRAATTRNNSDSGSADIQEAEFVEALKTMATGDFSAAASAFKSVAVSRPSEKRYRLHMHYAQGRVHQSEGRVDEARAEYKRCLGLDATFGLAHDAMTSLPKEGKKKSSFMSKLFGK